MKATFRLFTILLITLSLFGCNSTKDKIIGKWENKDDRLEFLKDGTIVLKHGSESTSGKWAIMDDGRLRVDVASPLSGNQTILLKVTVNDSSLTTIDENNKSDTLTKVK